MKFKKIAALLCAIVPTVSLVSCAGSGFTLTFDNPSPWSGSTKYERTAYNVSMYKNPNSETPLTIASGTMVYTIEEDYRSTGTIKYSRLSSDFSITYNESADEIDRGKTDTIHAEVIFQTEGLINSTMAKTITYAPREGQDNRDAIIACDYFAGNASVKIGDDDAKTLKFTGGSYYDSNMIYMLARAQAMAVGTVYNFYSTSVPDSVESGKIANETLNATVSEGEYIDMGNLAALFPAKEDETREGNKVLSKGCTIARTVANSGPPFIAYYSDNDCVIDGVKHSKIMTRLSTYAYAGQTLDTRTDYVLSDVSYTRPTE